MSGEAPSVSIVVPVRNGERTIGDCLASLLALDHPVSPEIVVVDNASTDRTAEIVARYPVTCVREERRGCNHARNRGIEAARGEVLAFTDADCTVVGAWLTELLAGLSEESPAAVGEVLPYPPRSATERYWATRKPSLQTWNEAHPFPRLAFSSAAVRREVFDRVGRFDARFRSAAEDIDFSRRLWIAGMGVEHRPAAVALHRGRGTVGDLLRQHLAYGRGQAALVGKYPDELDWGWRRELGAWANLASSGLGAARAGVGLLTGVGNGGARREAEYQCLDFVRKVGQRMGFAWGAVESRGRP
jgi:O-antigen biosynthesis protein